MSDVKNENALPTGTPTPAPTATPQATSAAAPGSSAGAPPRQPAPAAPLTGRPEPQPPAPATSDNLDAEIEREVEAALGGQSVADLMDQATAAPAQPVPPTASNEAEESADFPSELVRGRIVRVTPDDVFVELMGLSGKNQGVVPLTQFERPPRLGSVMDFVVERLDEAEGLVHLSREGAVSRATWEQLQKGALVDARVVGTNKGGLEMEMVGGILAFMPASQIDLHHVEDLAQFVGQKLPGVVQEINRRHRRVILSRRLHLEQERERQREEAWQTLETGQLRDGVVRSLAEYGAFVDLGGVDGLLHISDMSYSRVNRPEELLKVGQQVKVKILKIDADKKRISLGLKQVAPDPWEGIETRLKVHDQISARVMRVQDFGAFVEVFAGVEGLLPASEISWRRNVRVSDTVKEGDVLRVIVMALDPAKRRLSLSLKQAGGNPWLGAAQKYPRHTLVEATILSIPEFGAFAELEPGVEGLVHISELSDKRVNTVTEVVKVGEKHQFRVLEVDEENRRIRLSLKAAQHPVAEQAPAEAGQAAKPAAKKPKPTNLKGGIQGAGLGIGLGQLKL